VLTCDNALPHLLTDDDLRRAAREMLGKLRTGGLLVASIRDYNRLLAERPQAEAPRVFDGPDGRRIVFQVWDWQPDAPVYTLSHFIVTDVEGAWQTPHAATTYRALQRHELDAILAEAGFREIGWLMPDESGYYQPIVTARA
jgi:glycine/sarcosine N-methyltransferase